MSNNVFLGSPDGIELDTTIYDKRVLYKNTTVEILEDSKTGRVSIGWYRQDNTEEISEEEFDNREQ